MKLCGFLHVLPMPVISQTVRTNTPEVLCVIQVEGEAANWVEKRL